MCVATGYGETRKVPSQYATIQAGIDASEDGDVVLVAPGVYFQTINFRGKDITVTSTDPDDSRVVGYTVLNADGEGSVVTFAQGETTGAVLSGFTITGGTGTYHPELGGSATEKLYMGAGIYCSNSSPTITKNVIVRNAGLFRIADNGMQVDLCFGGGIGCWQGSPIVTYNTIRNNSAYVAAGMIGYFGEPTVHNNVIFDNSAYLGGGLIVFAGSVCHNTIVRNDCDFGSTLGIGLDTGMGGNLYLVPAAEFGYLRVSNNVICDARSGGGLFWEGDLDYSSVTYNNVWGNSPGNYGYIDPQTYSALYDGDGDLTGLNGNISENPQFLSAASKNFHLTLESPCINAGDPEFIAPAGQTDMDGEERIYAARIDMGADEYVGYVKPVASAGPDVHVLAVNETVTLDGTGSFFYDSFDIQSYQWTQAAGPNVVLEGADSALPWFVAPAEGNYSFRRVGADSRYSSGPDDVLVYVGPNVLPVADAGEDRVWQAPGQITLDGTGSYDPDPVDYLSYTWTQLAGPTVVLQGPDSATPVFEAQPGETYTFELVVSDGFGDSEPSQVTLVAARATTDLRTLAIEPISNHTPRYADVSGTRIVAVADPGTSNWRIAWTDFATGLTETFSAGGFSAQPKVDGNLVVWAGGAPVGGSLTRMCTGIYLRDLAAEDYITLRPYTDYESYSHPAISGRKVVWVQHVGIDRNVAGQWANMPYDICGADISDPENPVYFTVATDVGRRDPFPYQSPANDYDDVVDISGDLVVWEGNGDIYAANIADLNNIRVFTVCDDPARQRDPAVSGRYVVWTDERNDQGDIYGAEILDPDHVKVFEIAKGRKGQRQPAVDGCMVAYLDGEESGGQIRLACITANHGVMNLGLPATLYGLSPVLEGTSLVWLSSYGPVQGLRLAFGYAIFDGTVQNATTGQRYDYVQHAIASGGAGDEIVLPEGVYRESIHFLGRALTVRSAAPDDPAVVAATVLEGSANIVTFDSEEQSDSILDGMTIRGGNAGILVSASGPTIKRCTITGNRNGMFLINQGRPDVVQSRIVANSGAGVEMWIPTGSRTVRHSIPRFVNCIVAGNRGAGMLGGRPLLTNCTVVENAGAGLDTSGASVRSSIIYFNDSDGAGIQINDNRAAVTYSDVAGGWSGEGNIDADPLFAAPGQWLGAAWLAGDYHLRSQGGRWNEADGGWVLDADTSPCIDAGDPAASIQDEPTTVNGVSVVNSRIDMGAYGGTAQASVTAGGN